MNVYQLKEKLSALHDEFVWADDVKLDVGGMVVEIADVEFDRERCEFYIKAVCR
jgi:hypothetical protein